MASSVREPQSDAPHLPVLIDAILEHVDASGVWLDGTFGAGGYSRAFLDAGSSKVIGVDRDPMVFDMAEPWLGDYGDRLMLVEGTFSDLDSLAGDLLPLDGVVLDLGVSSMQLDQPERGFSFLRDGPLDMRMGQDGVSAADLVNGADEALLADILFQYGEERASRRIARAILSARPMTTTGELAAAIESVLPKSKPGQSHPATRSFQAIRIAVNDEFGQLIKGLEAAERALKPGGQLAVVSFHSLEDRVVKKFLASRAGATGGGSRYAPAVETEAPTFDLTPRRAIAADKDELARNPRSRSAKLRVATRTETPPRDSDRAGLGLPKLVGKDLL
ncbi:16S rRNA (cytosine(1402)-N(4))-methyltransferase RsmH [uncultured Litoreibacter sp.]|uniref:16S rRNA (cytosine(1402)-N(4))-methyltransferase RsmH n=1 Tax=uncultured Litoreibacter sp. TaxID=1392394 RepID=UPI00261C0639|nr:16S rRNA (cytosine(1402)-N(4))-methyltransferase RsmH [uncultured Litoreibacter sp.]